LKKYTEIHVVDRELVKRTALGLLNACEGPVQGVGPTDRCLTSSVDTRPYVIPAVERDGVWRLQFDDVGVRRYFRYLDVDKMDSAGCPSENLKCNFERGKFRLEVGGKIYELPIRGASLIVFDAKKQVLFVFSSLSLTKSTFKGEASK
jgi:hypothetical protein